MSFAQPAERSNHSNTNSVRDIDFHLQLALTCLTVHEMLSKTKKNDAFYSWIRFYYILNWTVKMSLAQREDMSNHSNANSVRDIDFHLQLALTCLTVHEMLSKTKKNDAFYSWIRFYYILNWTLKMSLSQPAERSNHSNAISVRDIYFLFQLYLIFLTVHEMLSKTKKNDAFYSWIWFYYILNWTLKMSLSQPAERSNNSNANSVRDIDFHLQLALTCLTVHEMLSKRKKNDAFYGWICFYHILNWTLKMSLSQPAERSNHSNANSVRDMDFHLQLALTCLTVHEMLSKTKKNDAFYGWICFYHFLKWTLKMSLSQPAERSNHSNANSVRDIYFHLQLALTCLTVHEMLSKTKKNDAFYSWIWFYYILNWTLKMSLSQPAERSNHSNANSVRDMDFHLQLALTCLTVHEMLSKTKKNDAFYGWICFYHFLKWTLKMSLSQPAERSNHSNANSVRDIYFHLQLALTCLTVHEMLSKTKKNDAFYGWIWFYYILKWTLKMSLSQPAERSNHSNANSVRDIDFHLQLALTCLTVHEMLSKTKKNDAFYGWICFYHFLKWTLKMSLSQPAERSNHRNANSVRDIDFHLQLALTCLTVHEMLSKTKKNDAFYRWIRFYYILNWTLKMSLSQPAERSNHSNANSVRDIDFHLQLALTCLTVHEMLSITK